MRQLMHHEQRLLKKVDFLNVHAHRRRFCGADRLIEETGCRPARNQGHEQVSSHTTQKTMTSRLAHTPRHGRH
jgi:hypothetical protein